MGNKEIKDYSILRNYKIPWIFDSKIEKFNKNYFLLKHLFRSELFERKPEFECKSVIYLKLLYRYALKISGELYNAEELLHDTIIRAYLFSDKIQNGIDTKTWLLTIMRNCIINKYRKANQTAISDSTDGDDFYNKITQSFVYPGNTDKEEFSSLLDIEIIKALATLRGELKSAMILRYIIGFNEAEISVFMDCSIEKVRNFLQEGRHILQENLIHFQKLFRFAKSINLNSITKNKVLPRKYQYMRPSI